MKKPEKLAGVVPASVTPFKANEEVGSARKPFHELTAEQKEKLDKVLEENLVNEEA